MIEAALEESDGHGGFATGLLLDSESDWLQRQQDRELKESVERLKQKRAKLKDELANVSDFEIKVPCARPAACQSRSHMIGVLRIHCATI